MTYFSQVGKAWKPLRQYHDHSWCSCVLYNGDSIWSR